jgi:hypothetical protein
MVLSQDDLRKISFEYLTGICKHGVFLMKMGIKIAHGTVVQLATGGSNQLN